MSRRPMLITSSRTEETVYCSGIRATGRASVTDTTASRHATRTTHLSTSTERSSPILFCGSDLLMGAGTASGGGFTFTGESKQKTVAPPRVKNRKFEGPPVYWDPDSPPFTVIVTLSGKRKMRIFRTFPIAAAENYGGTLHTGFCYKTGEKVAIFRQKMIEKRIFSARNRILQFSTWRSPCG